MARLSVPAKAGLRIQSCASILATKDPWRVTAATRAVWVRPGGVMVRRAWRIVVSVGERCLDERAAVI
jgi:hypothetical protein